MADKSNLEIAIEWIYAHVKPEAVANLKYRIAQQQTVYGADVYRSYTALIFEWQGVEFSTRAAILAESPHQAEYVLYDLRERIGVPINLEYYRAPGKAAATFDPVGDRWSEKSDEVGRPCYRVGNQSVDGIYEGMSWDSPSKGLVTAAKGRTFFGWPFWYWVKANA